MKTMTKLAGISSFVAMCSLSTQAAVLEGSEPKEWPADPASHVVKIKRTITEADDAKWITAAENIPADAAAVRAAALQHDANAAVGEKEWWYMESEDVKIPFALTGDTVTFYSGLVTGYGMQKAQRFIKPSSHFSYNATVSQQDKFTLDEKTFQNVTVVTLRMKFRYESDRSISLSKQRVVVFNKDGKALHVSGDGKTQVKISVI